MTAGEMDVAFLFAKDAKLQWDYEMYTYYTGLKFGLGTLVLMALSPVARHLGVSDGVMAIVGLVSRMVGMILEGFATSTAVMFAVPVVSMFNTFCLPSIRSMLSKQVETSELGQLFAFVASVENVCVLLGSVIFNSLYPITRLIFRGLIFELCAVLLCCPFVILLFLEIKSRRQRQSSPS